MPNSIELVEAMAAVLKLGALIVPLSTRLAAREIAYIIGHCEPSAVLYSEAMRDSVAAALETLPGRGADRRRRAGGGGGGVLRRSARSGAARPPPAPPAAEPTTA